MTDHVQDMSQYCCNLLPSLWSCCHQRLANDAHSELPGHESQRAQHILWLDANQYPVLRYTIGKVIGAGSFGVVREAVHKRTNLHYACKTIPKLPKKGRGTPRYLLKIQTEVDAMLQLGPSLDAVFLQVLLVNVCCDSKIVSWSGCVHAHFAQEGLRCKTL